MQQLLSDRPELTRRCTVSTLSQLLLSTLPLACGATEKEWGGCIGPWRDVAAITLALGSPAAAAVLLRSTAVPPKVAVLQACWAVQGGHALSHDEPCGAGEGSTWLGWWFRWLGWLRWLEGLPTVCQLGDGGRSGAMTEAAALSSQQEVCTASTSERSGVGDLSDAALSDEAALPSDNAVKAASSDPSSGAAPSSDDAAAAAAASTGGASPHVGASRASDPASGSFVFSGPAAANTAAGRRAAAEEATPPSFFAAAAAAAWTRPPACLAAAGGAFFSAFFLPCSVGWRGKRHRMKRSGACE